jgi:apolipoprotein N-acyltransferase
MSTDNFLEFKTEGSPTETTEKTDKRSIFLVSLLVEFLLFCCRLKWSNYPALAQNISLNIFSAKTIQHLKFSHNTLGEATKEKIKSSPSQKVPVFQPGKINHF